MAAKQAMKESLQCTSKYGHLRILQDICHVRMTDVESFLTIYGHGDNLLNNNSYYTPVPLTISSNQQKLSVKKQLYFGKVPSLVAFVAIKQQHFELLAQEIKCRHSTTDLCAKYMQICLFHPVVLVSLDNLHNNVNMTKSTVLGYDVSCLKRGYLHLLTVHSSPTQ